MTSTAAAAVRVTGLRKSFQVKGAPVAALTGIDLAVAPGEIFGLLGPNGAGKTTTLRILTTLLPADAGEALVAGADVRREPALVRRRIGYVGQLGGADVNATGRENLLLAGRLYGLTAAGASRRCAELLGVFGLGDGGLADRAVRTYSGGQRRRLEVALGIMHRPGVLFLDEPTTGLDPQNRANLWDQLRELRDGGATVFLTTHYLDEADQLSDRVAIVDHGWVIALGTPDELKRRYSADTISVTPDPGAPEAVPMLARELARDLAGAPFVDRADVEDGAIRLTVTDTTRAMAAVFGVLAARGIPTRAASVARPSLDDVFLRETGRSLRDKGEETATAETAEVAA
ncbi:MAG TPA: ATP-binding cassette domain-containing protein [Trebonia sp.]|nr:ATP-binding cassette domain-containing protein [Trebonia sp.]